MRSRHLSVLAVLAVGLAFVGAGSAAQQSTQQIKPTATNNDVVDTAVEYDRVHKGAPDPTDSGIRGHQHGGSANHLPASNANVDLVSKLELQGAEVGRFSDVAVLKNHAFVGDFGATSDATCTLTGAYVIDISDPENPREIRRAGDAAGPLIPATPGTFVGENVHAITIDTPSFQGDVLMIGHEACIGGVPGGVSFFDITDPGAPVPLAQNVGDNRDGDMGTPGPRAHFSHSGFMWDAGDRAYAMIVDNEEVPRTDVDILDITNPAAPVLISETGLSEWPDVNVNGFGDNANHHDSIVRKVGNRWLALVAYWDAGYIVLDVTDPANPVFVKESDYPATDPLTGMGPEQGGPEGNAHEAEWSACPERDVTPGKIGCADPEYILAADEDFSPYRLERGVFEITTGPNAGEYPGGEFGFTVPIVRNFADGQINGKTVWGGTGCQEDVNANGVSDRNEVPPASNYEWGPGEEKIIVFTRGVCFFSIKVESGQMAGYNVVVIGNSHGGSGNGAAPNAHFCGGQGHEYEKTASAICIGHRPMHLLFNDEPAYTGTDSLDMPAIGTVGEAIFAKAQFDGWGYLNLIDADSMEHLDAFAVRESLDERFASGFGDLSIHEVTTDPLFPVGYVSYYSAGFRVYDWYDGELREPGHYIDEGGNDFWGVQMWVRPGTDEQYVLASDRDYGLYIFRYGADVALRKTASRDVIRIGETVRYVIRATNTGTIAAEHTMVRDRLPANLTLVSASASQGSCSGTRTIICDLGTLAEDGQAQITIVARATRAGTVTNTARSSSIDVDYDIGNNVASKTTRVRAALAPAGCAMTVTPNRFREDRTTPVTVRVRENDGDPAANRVVTFRGAGVFKSARTNALGVAETTIRPTRAGALRVNVPSLPNCMRTFSVAGAGPALTG